MNPAADRDMPGGQSARVPGRRWIDLGGSWGIFRWLVIAAATWYLLKELAPLLRPLLLAILLAYVLLPVRLFVRGGARGGAGHLGLLIGLGLILVALVALAYGDVVDLSHEIPRLHQRFKEIADQLTRYTAEKVPGLANAVLGTASAEEQGAARFQEVLSNLANMTAGVLVETLQVAFFLILILVEAGRFPERMRHAFANGQAEQILTTVAHINAAVASYLKAKVKVNLALALPAMLVLWIFGVKYVVLWGALTFLANFVPYLGSVVACALPILFGFLDLDFGWRPVAAAVVLIAVHGLSAYLVEPAMTGKAVNLSPLAVLIALTFWGLCWGLVGMVLAVPLTAMLKIILDSAPSTRPIAWLMGED